MRDPTTALTARQASATKLDALCRKARILRAATSGGYGDALAARLAAAGARAAQARRRGRPAVTPERLREMMSDAASSHYPERVASMAPWIRDAFVDAGAS